MTRSSTIRSWMSAISQIARAVNDDRELGSILTGIAEHACALIGFDYCAIMLAEDDGDHLTVAGQYGLSPDYVALVSEGSGLATHPREDSLDSPAGRAFRERRTIVVADTSVASGFGRLSALAPTQGYRSLLATPLGETEDCPGILVGYLRLPHPFDATDVELAELLANQTAIALRTAELRRHQQATIVELRHHRTVRDWADQQHRRLMNLVLDDIGLDGLVEALADMLGADVLVEDRSGAVLARTTDRDIRTPVTPPGGGDLHEGELHPGYEAHRAQPGSPGWVAPVMLGASVGGHLWVSLADGDLGTGQRTMMERFAVVVGLEMLKRRHVAEVEERLSGDLLGDLLRPEGITQPRSVLERAAALGHDLGAPHWLAVLAFHGDGAPAGGVAGVVGQAARSLSALSGRYEDTIVVLLPASIGDPLPAVAQIRSAVAEHIAPVEVSALLSSRVEDLAGHARSYALAAGSARLRRSSLQGRVVDLRGLRVTSLLLISGTLPRALRDFAVGLLEPLRAQDERKGTDLVETVRTWLASGCSVADTARQLVVHPNTVTYRLGRAEDLLGRDLRHTDTRLDVQLALDVADVLLLDPPG